MNEKIAALTIKMTKTINNLDGELLRSVQDVQIRMY